MGSISKEEKDRLKAIIADTVTLLCKNGLNAKFKREFTVEGLIGITLDKDDLLLVSIKECIENPSAPPPSTSGESSGDSSGEDSKIEGSSGRKRKRKRKKKADGETPSKASKTFDDDSDYETNEHGDNDNLHSASNTPAKQFSSQNPGASNMDSSNMESNDSLNYLTLQDIKQDHSDDDLIEIIKEEPGLRTNPGAHIVSIQSVHSGQQLGPMGSQFPPGMSPGAMPPVMSPGSSHMGPGPGGPGVAMAPGQYEDLMQQVELIPGSGVYIKKATYNQLQFIDKGSKLVRKLVREIFPDVHLLASSSCMGKGETSAGLDRHKVEVIKGFACEKTGISAKDAVRAINLVCTHTRNLLRKKGLFESK